MVWPNPWSGPIPQQPFADNDTPVDHDTDGTPKSCTCPICRGEKAVREYANDTATIPCDFCNGNGRLFLKETNKNDRGILATYTALGD